MIIWVQVGVSKNSNVLLEISDLVVEVDELLGLLLDKEGSVCNIKVHYRLLLVPDVLKVSHLVFSSLETILPLFLENISVAGECWGLLDSLGKSCLLHFSHLIIVLLFDLLPQLLDLGLSSERNKGLVLLCGRWIDLVLSEISILDSEIGHRRCFSL